ncbi:hypothetical protein ACHAXA_005691 [Cyclostephanos tholiformis]|uniref:Uncharacterized protein n=1 Tax=Cyclostephanos tholiformis TaxID=382380 RepID=A0ABD3SQG7_9STRA
MAVHRAALATAIYVLCIARDCPRNAHGFAPSSSTSATRSSSHSTTTTTTSTAPAVASYPVLLRAAGGDGTEPTATERAAILRARAEEAKRKAEELRKVAETKAEAVMVAMKKNAEDGGYGASGVGGVEVSSEASSSSTSSTRIPVAPSVPPKAVASSSSSTSRSSVDSSSPGGSIIPINRENVEFASGVLAGGLALALGASPVLAIVAAAAVNYVSKKDDLGELHELVQGLSRASLTTINWLAKLDSKYAILGKLSDSLERSIGELKNSTDAESAETFKAIEETVSKTTRQIQKLADEIDLLEGGKQALGAMGEVLETSIDKAVDANKEYKLTERAAEAAKKALERAKEMNK